MLKSDFDPDITRCVILTLLVWIDGIPVPLLVPTHHSTSVQRAQAVIGWPNFLEDLLSEKWAPLQTQYFQASNSRKGGHTMIQKLLPTLWDTVHAMWKDFLETLHNENNSAQSAEIKLLNTNIRQEFYRGLGLMAWGWNRYFIGEIRKYQNISLQDGRFDMKLLYVSKNNTMGDNYCIYRVNFYAHGCFRCK